ncbi:MAG: cell filamentation protein Fic, partial [Treponema sp.]|nr:cell filamentation protein Fic [Treponema sp.]
RLEYLRYRKFSKPDRIRAVIAKKTGRISKKDILEACPDISRITVERTLTELVKDGSLVKIGAGRAAAYAKGT